MPFTQKALNVHVHAPALTGGESRPEKVVRGLEGALPGLRLEWTVSAAHQLVPVSQRETWLVQARWNGGFPLVCNNDVRFPVTIFGVEESSRFGPGGQALLEVHAELPLATSILATAEAILEGIAEGARGFWGHATPFDASVEVSWQTRDPQRKPGSPPRGLPVLKLPEDIRSPEIPHRLGWVNYWSAAAARAIGFPDPSRDADLLVRARRTASGGWVVRLTEAPLDLEDPSHLDALRRAYERFPVVGGRSAP